MAKALKLEIYKHKGDDCSNGGISSKYNEILLLNDKGNYEVDLNNPPENLCVLEKRELWGEPHWFVRPYADCPEGHVGWMYGGCIVDTCDGRMESPFMTSSPLHLHDRSESQKMYDALSR